MHLSRAQYEQLMKPLNSSRVASRKQGGKSLSYLEAWDVKAHLTRIFGFGNWDFEIINEQFMGAFPYAGSNGPMVEVVWQARGRLRVRTEATHDDDFFGDTATYAEGAVGSATGKADASGIGDLHDNALKSAASDALKRCAINLGTQFGLSLYNDGQTTDVVKRVLVGEPTQTVAEPNADQADKAARLAATVGAVEVRS